MIELAEARRTVLGGLQPLSARRVALQECLDLVVAEDLRSPEPVPGFANSAMDGYALRAADTIGAPVRLEVVDTVLAGDDPRVTVGPGQAARIMTGAPLPAGADAVCMIEHTRPAAAGSVMIDEVIGAGQHVRPAGDDVAAGQLVVPRGTALTAAHIGMLASVGFDEVPVHPKPRVAVLSTGNELVVGSGKLPPGKIRDSNRPALLAALATDAFPATDLGVVADDEDDVRLAFAEAARTHDAVVTTGGVSVGDRDVVRIVLESLGGPDVHWMQVAIKPAKPLAFGRLGESRTPVFGLPGNPVSALVSYELFVRPALRAMAGRHRLDRPVVRAVAVEPMWRAADGKLHLVRVRVTIGPDGQLLAAPVGGQGSHQLRAMTEANALALLADGDGVVSGDPVPVVILDPGAVPDPDDTRLGAGPGTGLVPRGWGLTH